MVRRYSPPNLDALTQYGEDDPTGYLTDVPAAVRQLAEARSRAQTGAEVYSRNRVARNFDALGAGVTELPQVDAGPDALKILLQLQDADRRAKDAKATAERVDQYGTPYRYEARQREASGGVYRDDASVNRLLRHDPAALLAELQAQQGQGEAPPPDASGDLGGTFSVIGGGDPRTEARKARLAELLGLTETTTRTAQERAARKANKEAPEDRAARLFQEDLTYSQQAKDQGVAAIVAAIKERASREPRFAAIAGKLIQGLKNRRFKDKDLEETPGEPPKTIFGPDLTLLDDRLPRDAPTAALLRTRRDDEIQRAAERGFW